MNRTAVALVALLVVAGVAPAAATVAQDGSETPPGAKLAGVVGVQGTELESEVAARAFEKRLERADTNASKAAVVADQVEELDERLAALRERRRALNRSLANGSISEGTYRARLAALAAAAEGLERRANRTAAVARDLPAEALRARGVDTDRIERLRTNASELTGGEVSEIAREIAGKGVGRGFGGERGPPADSGPPDEAGPPGDNESDPANDRGGQGRDRGNEASDAGADNTTDDAGKPADPPGESADGTGRSAPPEDGASDGRAKAP